MRIVHLSDVHLWRYSWNPLRLMSKRAIGMASLLAGRARKFRLERLGEAVDRALGLEPDHVLITGDLTTTALKGEFDDALRGLSPLLDAPSRATVIPGNHDRYTGRSHRNREFERHFGRFMPSESFPWIRFIDDRTAILGLDATRAHISATGRLPEAQLQEAARLLETTVPRPARLIVASHYPVLAPPVYREELYSKRMLNADEVLAWLDSVGPHLYCCGHVHAAWSYRPKERRDHVCLNAGAPLLRDKTGLRPPGFLEIELHDDSVTVIHHAWNGQGWEILPLIQIPDFFPVAAARLQDRA